MGHVMVLKLQTDFFQLSIWSKVDSRQLFQNFE